jgi:hypothetical protein
MQAAPESLDGIDAPMRGGRVINEHRQILTSIHGQMSPRKYEIYLSSQTDKRKRPLASPSLIKELVKG